MHHCPWWLLLLCAAARASYQSRVLQRPRILCSPARPRRGHVVSACARRADSGCVLGLGKRASQFRWLGVEKAPIKSE